MVMKCHALFIKDVLEIENEKWKFSSGVNEMELFHSNELFYHVF